MSQIDTWRKQDLKSSLSSPNPTLSPNIHCFPPKWYTAFIKYAPQANCQKALAFGLCIYSPFLVFKICCAFICSHYIIRKRKESLWTKIRDIEGGYRSSYLLRKCMPGDGEMVGMWLKPKKSAGMQPAGTWSGHAGNPISQSQFCPHKQVDFTFLNCHKKNACTLCLKVLAICFYGKSEYYRTKGVKNQRCLRGVAYVGSPGGS